MRDLWVHVWSPPQSQGSRWVSQWITASAPEITFLTSWTCVWGSENRSNSTLLRKPSNPPSHQPLPSPRYAPSKRQWPKKSDFVAACTSKKIHCHARIACVAVWFIKNCMLFIENSVQFSHGCGFFTQTTCKMCDTNHIPVATAYPARWLGPTQHSLFSPDFD